MKKVVFVHPDLGIGGAERLVVDAALALKKKGHNVRFVTAHHDPTHCFPETANGQLDVIAAGDWLPRSTCGMLYAFWAYVRMLYIAFYLAFVSGIEYDVAFVDQISACVPILQCKRNTKIIFYCHYPDQLLTTRVGFCKRLYRCVLDRIELETTKRADIVLVNSKYTAGVFRDTFPSVTVAPCVLYPSLHVGTFDDAHHHQPSLVVSDLVGKITFLSLNRYERKKNISLAIEAFCEVANRVDESYRQRMRLVIAGGYDGRVRENRDYFHELHTRCQSLGIGDAVTFFKSPSDPTKVALLKVATCLLYTPAGEHFGIVPLEAMYVGTPVIAVASGGPLETVVDGVTGFLRQPHADQFCDAMRQFVDGDVTKAALGAACTARVVEKFSFDSFACQLHDYVQSLCEHE